MNKILISLLFGLSLSTYSFAQCPTPDPKSKTMEHLLDPESEFDLSCGYHQSEDVTNVSIDFRITGDGPYDYVDIDKGTDPIKGRISFQVKGNMPIEPKSIFLQFYTHSASPLRYLDGVKLTILVDGKVLLSSGLTLKDTWKVPAYTTKWFWYDDIPYKEFLKIVQAQKVTFQIGDTKAELKPRELQRIRNLNNVIQKPDSESSQ